MTRPVLGQLIDGRYRVEGRDGDGLAATDLTSGKRVHVAFVPRSAVPGARRAMGLVGANVVRILDVGETPEGATWIARAHVSSVSLTKHLARRGPLTLTEAVEIALGLCDAVAEGAQHGLYHGAIDASCVYVGWSASGLVDVQLAGIGTGSTSRPRDDVQSIAKLITSSVASALPTELAYVLKRIGVATRPVLDFAELLCPFALDPDFATDRVASRRQRGSMSHSVIADGARPDVAMPAVVKDVVLPAPRPVRQRKISRDLPTVIAHRPRIAHPLRRTLRILGVVAAALSVALLVLIGTEGARLAHPKHVANALVAAPVEIAPPAAPIAPPVVIVSATPSAAPIPVVNPSDLPVAKTAKKKR